MAASPVLSPKPNPPGTKQATNASKAKALAILNHGRNVPSSTAPSTATTPGEGGQDLADQMNEEVRQQFVSGMLFSILPTKPY
jgi:cyclin-dependent kinase 7